MAGAQPWYQALLILSVLVSTGTALYVWASRDRRGALPLVVVFASATLWGIAALVEALWPTVGVVLLVSKVILVAVVLQVVGFLLFALAYTGRESYVTRRTALLLSIEPAVFTALVWTNSAHGLVWTATRQAGGGLEFAATPIFWAHTVYSYGILAVGVVLILLFAFRSKYLYQRQATALVVATLAPWFANVASLTVVDSYHLTPIAFALTAVVFTWAVVSEDFLDISPVATELVMDTIDTAVFVVDEQGRVVDFNDAAVGLLDIEEATTVGESVDELLADRPAVQSVYGALATRIEPTTQETTIGDQHVRIQMSPLREHDDRLVGRAFIIVDLTEQREREEELRRRNEQLDRFAGVVSHDLRNPLEVASGSLQLARETGDEAHFDRAERAHDRMNRLIEDILTLARQEDDALVVDAVDLDAQVREAWGYVNTGSATLDVRVDGQSVEADADRISQLLENCFRNAVEHGGATVSVTVGSFVDSTGFYVADDGPGWGDVDLSAVFEAGYTTSDQGTGFGLSIVEEIATVHGWSVAAAESDDGGARIEMRTQPDARSRH